MSVFSLATLGQFADAQPDQGLRDRNLAALDQVCPDYAAAVKAVEIPPYYRATATLDGSVSFRVNAPDSPDTWLAETAMPLRRAEALCNAYRAGDLNCTLPSIGAGAELRMLLDRLPGCRAVYVFEQRLEHVAAVLWIADFADDIARGRCIFLPPDSGECGRPARSAETELTEMLEQHPGLLPPGNILCAPDVAADRIASIQKICEHVAECMGRRRSEQIGELAQRGTRIDSLPSQPRVAIMAITPDPRALHQARQLADAVRDGMPGGLGLETCCRTLVGPHDVHLLAHCRAVSEFRPDLSICIGHTRGMLPLPVREIACEWVIDAHAVDDAPAARGDSVIQLAASPSVLARLHSATSDAAILPFFHACPAEPQASATGSLPSNTIVLASNLPDDRPEACGIEQPTHRMLWSEMRDIALKNWASDDAHALLGKAERARGLQLNEAALREKLLHIVRHVLIPAVVLERIYRTLRNAATPFVTIGTGWQRWSEQGVTTLADNLHEYLRRNDRIEPVAAVFAGAPDPLSSEILRAAGLGWPLICHARAGRSLAKAFGGILIPAQHMRVFSGESDLCAALQEFADHPEKRRKLGQQARKHLLTHHTYRHRLTALLEALKTRIPE